MEPSTEDRDELENYARLMAADTNDDEDLTTPHNAATDNSALDEVATYPCPDFNITHRQSAAATPTPFLKKKDKLASHFHPSGSGFGYIFGYGTISSSTAWL